MKVGDPIPYWQDPVSMEFEKSGAHNPASDLWMIDSAVGDTWKRGVQMAENSILPKYRQGTMMYDGLKVLLGKSYWLGK
jgi:hypothetical protein